MDAVTSSAAQDKDDYLFLCTCSRCRTKGWTEVKEGELFPWDDSSGRLSEKEGWVEMRPVPGKAEYRKYSTIKGKGKDGHFNKEVSNFKKNGTASAAASNAQLYREGFHRLMSRKWWLETVGTLPFAIPDPGKSTRAKRRVAVGGAISCESDSQVEGASGDSADSNVVIGDIEGEFTSVGDEEEPEEEDDKDADELWNRARLHAATREAHLDSIRTIDDLHQLSKPLKELYDNNSDMAENAVELAELLLDEGASIETIRKATRIVTRQSSQGRPGFTLDPLMRKFKATYEQNYSCQLGHDLSPDEGGWCPTCGKGRTVRSLKMDLETVFRHALRQPEVAEHIHWGPKHQAEFLHKMRAAAASAANPRGSMQDRDSIGAFEALPISSTMNCDYYKRIENVWESPDMAALMEKLGWLRGMEAYNGDDPSSTPVPYQLFIDAVQPFNGGYSMIVGMVRLLNLPTHLANKHIQVAFVIDGIAKPKHIDAVLRGYMEDTVAHAPRDGDPPPPIWAARLGNTDKTVQVVPVLFDFPMDSRSMMMVAHHREAPAKEPCNKCTLRSRQLRNPVTGVVTTVYDNVDGSGESLWVEKDDISARIAMTEAGRIANEHPESVELLTSFVSCPVWEIVWYTDAVWCLPECSMHQIANVVRRITDHLSGEKGWGSEAIGRWVESGGEGMDWANRSGLSLDKFEGLGLPPGQAKKKQKNAGQKLAPSKAKPPPRAGVVVKPGERHWKQAYRALATILPPSNFNGKPAHSLYYTLAASSKGDKHHRDIKASEHLDNARCGVMGISAEFCGCDAVVAEAIAELGYAIKKLTGRVVDRQEILFLHLGGMHAVVQKLENVLPPSERIPALHKLIHLPMQVLRKGPLPDLWSFPFESMFAKLKPLILKNKAMPAQTLMSRLALQMALSDLVRIMKPTPHANNDANIFLSTPVAHSPGATMEIKQMLKPLLSALARESSNPQHYQFLVDNYAFQVTEYKKLTICGSVEIQGARSTRRRTDNRHVLLSTGQPIPTLGKVESIYGISMNVDDPGANPGRIYLLVDEHVLSSGPERHPEVYSFARTRGERRLVTLDSVVDQCFLGADPDHPQRIDNRFDLVPVEPTEYVQHLVYTKGSLRHRVLDRGALVSRPDSQ